MDEDRTEPEPWMLELKRRYEAGHFKTEAAVGEQETFPWQGKVCGDCPFWLNTVWCEVHAADRPADEHTCSYFDDAGRPLAQGIIDERLRVSRRRFLDWISGEH
jgi:hypothetical protein